MFKGIIPIVDFSGFSVDLSKDKVNNDKVKFIAKQIHKAFSQIGFVYIINHGIKEELVSLGDHCVYWALCVNNHKNGKS